MHHTATHCNALRHTTPHWNALQHHATPCNVLQHTGHTATRCNTLQHAATHCNTLQHTDFFTHNRQTKHNQEYDPFSRRLFATTIDKILGILADKLVEHGVQGSAGKFRQNVRYRIIWCDTLQNAATHCNTLQHTAPRVVQVTSAKRCGIESIDATCCNTLQPGATLCNALQHSGSSSVSRAVQVSSLQMCMHTCMKHTYMHTNKYTYTHTLIHTYRWTCIHMEIYTYIHTYIHACMYIVVCIHG